MALANGGGAVLGLGISEYHVKFKQLSLSPG
jgi:hypothetical protein